MADTTTITQLAQTEASSHAGNIDAFEGVIDLLEEAFRIESLLQDPFDPALSEIAHAAATAWADVETRAYEIIRGADPTRASAAFALLELLQHDGTSPETIMQPVAFIQRLLTKAPAKTVFDLPLRRQLATMSQFMLLIAAQALDTNQDSGWASVQVNACL
ncbi:hypothetical protein G0P98_19905 [Yangia sp. PrR004]|nr:hypothetical protein [Salipiger sp. PrR004]